MDDIWTDLCVNFPWRDLKYVTVPNGALQKQEGEYREKGYPLRNMLSTLKGQTQPTPEGLNQSMMSSVYILFTHVFKGVLTFWEAQFSSKGTWDDPCNEIIEIMTVLWISNMP